MIVKFIQKVESELDHNIYNCDNSQLIKINQLIKLDDNAYKVVGYILENPTTEWYPARFEVIEKVIEGYELKSIEEGDNLICTIYSECIPDDTKPLVNMIIKYGDDKIVNILDYSESIFEIGNDGKICMNGTKKYTCNVADFKLINKKGK